MLRYTALIALALAPIAPVFAAPAQIVAEKDGYKFEYTSTIAPGGKVLIAGRMMNPDAPFTYEIEPNGAVHGYVDGSPVSFSISAGQHDALVAETMDRNGVAVAEAGIGQH